MSVKDRDSSLNQIEANGNLEISESEQKQENSLNKLYFIKRLILFVLLIVIFMMFLVMRLTLNINMTDLDFDKNLTNLSDFKNYTSI
jgi:flagellar biogenesis protein FliO